VKLQIAETANIGGSGEVRLPETILEELGWKHDDRLLVEIVDGDRVILSRHPSDIVDHTAGSLTHLYPEPGDAQRFLDEEHTAWDGFDRRFDV
jgi:bifunctional DNA-binding transcriptional regulator/antitoxin component of YhaV-PrlF toxin-antitoxin module